jgi:hypothetical protein
MNTFFSIIPKRIHKYLYWRSVTAEAKSHQSIVRAALELGLLCEGRDFVYELPCWSPFTEPPLMKFSESGRAVLREVEKTLPKEEQLFLDRLAHWYSELYNRYVT